MTPPPAGFVVQQYGNPLPPSGSININGAGDAFYVSVDVAESGTPPAGGYKFTYSSTSCAAFVAEFPGTSTQPFYFVGTTAGTCTATFTDNAKPTPRSTTVPVTVTTTSGGIH